MTGCPHCGTEFVDGKCPVCAGSATEATYAISEVYRHRRVPLIQARDRAIRRKSLEEAAGVCDAIYESDDKARHDSMYLQGFEWGAEKCELAIRALMEEV